MQTVLVVEDDATVRGIIEVILVCEGFTVFTAATGHAALDLVKTTPVDLIAIDLGLQDMDGMALARAFRQHPASRHCRQMLVSGRPLASADTVDAVLMRPFDFAAFTATLHGLVSSPVTGTSRHPTSVELDRILAGRLVTPLFQPIVDLGSREIVGVEALARGPVGSALHLPGPLFDAAHRDGRLHELDSLCRFSAITTAREQSRLAPPLVFVNVEPGTSDLPMTAELRSLLNQPLPFRVVVEFTERALTRRLPALMHHAAQIRGRGNVIALDDMGVDPRAVAMLPLLRPEIVKLDMSLLHADLTETAAITAVAVSAYAERTGATVIAEGIETEEHLAAALALGATWGQGWLFGRPGPLDALAGRRVARSRPRLPRRVETEEHFTPYEAAVRAHLPRIGNVQLLQDLSLQLETKAATLGDIGVVIACVPDASITDQSRYPAWTELARRAAVVGVLGPGVPAEPAPGVYGVNLTADDPLAQEWVVLVIGPQDASVLCARPLPGSSPGSKRPVEFILSHDRGLATLIARRLTRRFAPRPSTARTTALSHLRLN